METIRNSRELELPEFFKKFALGPVQKPTHPHLLTAFEAQVAANPQSVAVVWEQHSITYAELNQQAEKLASELQASGVSYQDNVGLFVRRSIPMVVGILAILKLGAIYVPQDVKISPTQQLTYVMRSADINVVLTLSEFQHRVPIFGRAKLISIDKVLEKAKVHLENKVKSLPNRFRRPSDTCFILYTSGTTGKPNGVQVTHGNLTNIILTDPGRLGMAPGRKVSQILNIAFDMAAWEILGSLCNGATLVIRGKDIQEVAKKVDIVIATPSILSSLNSNELTNVKTVAVAGEPCPKPLADEWSQVAEFYNSCGPTEVTIVNTMKKYNGPRDKVSIGRPTPNNTVYILDEKMKPCKTGEIGEMWAGGPCVSKGYVKNMKLTKERYKPDPFLGDGKMMFRTRDLGRWTEDGEIEHFGRTDDQVKIRGFRVELDSISMVLESTPECQQAITLKLDDKDLVSFVRPANINVGSLIHQVQDQLPYYCKPAVIISLDQFPKTDRGKIDKRALTVMAVDYKENKGGCNV